MGYSPALCREIQVVADSNAYIYEKEGQPSGILVDLVNAMMARAGIEAYHINILPWARAYNYALKKENTLILAMARTRDREPLFKWIGRIMPIHFYFVRLSNKGYIDINSLEQAKKYRLGVFLKDVSHQYFIKKGFTSFSTANSPELLLRMLDNQRVDIIPITRERLLLLCKQKNRDISAYTLEWKIDDLSLDLYAAFSRSTDDALFLRVKKGLQEIKSDKTYDGLMKNEFQQHIQ